MRRIGLRNEVHRALDELAREIACHVPQDPETVRRVLELAAETDLDDPEKFLRCCTALGVNPVEILTYLARRNSGRRPVHRVRLDLRRGRNYWGWFLMICGGLVTVSAAFSDVLWDTLAGGALFGLGLLVLRRARRI